MATTSPSPVVQPTAHAEGGAQWKTVVWDDPVNLMTYVAKVFRQHFGYPAEKAHALMMEVHMLGKAVVSQGTREHMEADVRAMHSYGLNATLEQV